MSASFRLPEMAPLPTCAEPLRELRNSTTPCTVAERSPQQPAPIGVRLPMDLRGRLQALSEFKRRTPHWLMVEAIRLYVEREEEVERARAETREAIERYDATGEYIADEDVEAWLESWGTKAELPPPRRVRRRTR